MKKLLLAASIIFLVLIAFFNRYLTIEHNINLLDLVNNSYKLTAEEKAWLKEHGELVYGSDNNSPPLRYLDDKTGQYQGVTIDYLAALSLELGVNIKVKPMVWNDALESLKEGKIDMCDMYTSFERGKVYDFSNPIHYQRSIILTSSESDIRTYKDLKGKKVAAQKGDYAHSFLENTNIEINFVYTVDYEESLRLIQQGKVDAIVGDEPVINYFVEIYNLRNEFKIVEDPLFEAPFVLGIPKGNKMLLNILNKGIYSLKKKNVMTRIQQKWFGISRPITQNNSNEVLNLIISFFSVSILITVMIFIMWNKRLKREVEKRTQELNVSKNDLQTTFDGVTNLMIVINKDCTVTNVNKAFCKTLKVRYRDMVGKKCGKFFREISGEDNICIIRETLLTGKNIRKETRNNGRVYELSSFALEDKDGMVDRVLIMMKDITELKIKDKQILQSNKMAAVGQLAAGVAHEIRNPLGIIRNSSYILKKNIRSNPELAKESLDMMDEAVKRASGIIDNLLNFSRLSPNTTEKANILTLINSIIKLHSKPLLTYGITEEINCDPYLNCEINSEALKHILINLISNSIDAFGDGGRIRIEAKKENGVLIIIYSDDGKGIEEEHLDKIFNPFYTTKSPGKGTGLGLYIVYSEIDKLNGEIQVESEVNKGTTFFIKIPIEEEGEYDQ